MSEIVKEILSKFETSFLLRWVLPFCLLLGGIVGLLVLYPPELLKQDLDLSSFAHGTRTKIAIATITALVAGVLLIAFSLLHSAIKKRFEADQLKKSQEQKAKLEKEFAEDIDNLGPDELLLLTICVKRNTQVFNAPATNPTCTKLAQRGCFAALQPGIVNMLELPYTINPTLWKALKDRKQELLTSTQLDSATQDEVEAIWQKVAGFGW